MMLYVCRQIQLAIALERANYLVAIFSVSYSIMIIKYLRDGTMMDSVLG